MAQENKLMTGTSANRAVIAQCQVLTALGDLDATHQALMAGQSGLQPAEIPDVAAAYPAGRIAGLGDEYGSTARLRNLLQTGLGSLSGLTRLSGRFDLIVATTKGAADELLRHPANPSGQPWDIAAMAAELTGCTGKKQTVSAACASGAVALIQAARHIENGQAGCVLVIGIDILSTFVMAGFDSLKALSPQPCKPFAKNRDGLSLGEGMGAALVCNRAFAEEHKLPVLAGMQGWGVSCDATHITAPSRTGSGLIRVIELATRNGADPVGAINAHGTGTLYNDAMEITAFTSAWDDIPPFHSIKGAIGHCLGAAGIIEAAIALRSLEQGCIPPSIGYSDGDAPAGKISGKTALPLAAPTILTCNSGFGGINAGILFSKP